MVTLLHISDLHRSPDAPASNDYLLSCLLIDIARHGQNNPMIPKCDGIVVTGDLVEGVGIGEQEPEIALRKQYSEANEFLSKLCDQLLDGNRSRVFITPGNHDVCWPIAHRAMTKVPISSVSNIRREISKRGGLVRWSWGDLSPYVISNMEMYDRRLELFKDFFNDFYRGLGHSFELDPAKQTVNFVLPDHNLLLTSFCSLYGNDCFNHNGRVFQDAIATNEQRLNAESEQLVKIAFWHHSPATSSYQEDCLDTVDTLPLLIDRGYVLGLHGHQHRSNVTTFSDILNPGNYMPVVGCGSLGAGPYDIPPGYRRQYNILEINENSFTLRVHVREWFNNQVWDPVKLPEWNGNSWIEMKLPLLAAELSHPRLSQSLSSTWLI